MTRSPIQRDRVQTNMEDLIPKMLGCKVVAVTGVSRYPAKFGHRIHHFLKTHGYEVYPVNPNADCLDTEPCYPNLDALPVKPELVVTVTQPWVTATTVNDAIRLGIPYIWMQPGSEPRDLTKPGVEIVYGGPCIMVEIKRAQTMPNPIL